MTKGLWAVAGVLALGLAGNASAVPVTFDLASDSSVKITDFDGGLLCDLSDCGASVKINPKLDSLTNTLSAGQTWAFDLFSINFHGLGGGTGTLSATLGFDKPIGALDATGSGSGGFFSFLLTGGNLLWTSQPGSFSLSDGTSYSVFFENLSGVTIGKSVDVRAFLTLNTEPTGAPEPGTLALFGLGLLGVGLASRRRKAAKAD